MSEVLVLGGGLAGGAAAILLRRAGIPVRLLERESEPHHKICGEFLSIEAQRDIAGLGIDTRRLGAVSIDRVRLVSGARQVEAPLPFTAQGISRKILDEALLDLAAQNGARIDRGVRVTEVADREVVTNIGSCQADRILLATGKHDVRGAKRPNLAPRNAYVGFKMHWRASCRELSEMRGFIELVLFEGGYAGLQLVAPDVLNLCLIVRRDRLAECGGGWDDLLGSLLREPGLARRIGDAQALFERPLTIANLPYGYVCDPRSPVPEGVFRLGDQAAMTASLSGDGMAVALRSAYIAAESLAKGIPAKDYHERVRQTNSRQVRRAMMLQKVTESPLAATLGFGLLRLCPRLLGTLAGATRLPA